MDGWKEGWREGGRDGRREGGREGWKETLTKPSAPALPLVVPKHMKAESTLENVVQEVYRESGVRGCVPGGVSQVSGIRWIEQR